MKKMIVGNLKMNLLTLAERERYLESFKKEVRGKNFENSEVVLCVPVIHLEAFVKALNEDGFSAGVQNVFWEERGSFTGETSPLMVKNFGGNFVIVGHSERRNYFGETNQVANAKLKSCLTSNLSVVYCIGETKQEKDAGKTSAVIIKQIKEGLLDIPISKIGKIVLAYEPVWAVGSDIVPKSDEILAAKILIKKVLIELYGASAAEKVAILYGGSVKAKTAKQVCLDPEMDGVLVGRESLIPSEFVKIAEIIDKI